MTTLVSISNIVLIPINSQRITSLPLPGWIHEAKPPFFDDVTPCNGFSYGRLRPALDSPCREREEELSKFFTRKKVAAFQSTPAFLVIKWGYRVWLS